jgi:positive regulator of sigma E activity
MIEARVRVVSATADMAWVAANEESGCSACKSQSHCGISGLGKFLSRRRPDLPIPFANARPGDELQLQIAEADLLRAGLYVYLLPTSLAILGAVLADVGGVGDLYSALAAIAGFTVGLLVARWLAAAPNLQAQAISSLSTSPQSSFPITHRRTT